MDWRFETKLIQAGEPRPRVSGAVSFPIFQSSTFERRPDDGYHDLRYIRLNNTPNHTVLGEKLAALEGGEAALVTGSGMAAISATLLSLLSHGDHLISHRSLYGGTHDFIVRDLPRLGIEHTMIDADDMEALERAVRPTTRAVYVETLTNPLLEVVDLPGVADFCRRRGLISVIDNTCATPYNYRPLEHGFDLVVHSATKYLNGHSDIVAGAIVGSAARIGTIKRTLDHLGGALDPHACFLLHRGLKTLALRVRHQCDSALALARFLEKHPAVSRVFYPGLESHPRHARAREWFRASGGLLSFEVRGGAVAVERFFARAKIPADAPSLGGVETLMTRPSLTSHAGMDPAERDALGITDGVIRIAVGLEAPEDLLQDFERALA